MFVLSTGNEIAHTYVILYHPKYNKYMPTSRSVGSAEVVEYAWTGVTDGCEQQCG